MSPEEEARKRIDRLLEEAGWKVQDYRRLNLGISSGVAVRGFPLGSGVADYLLFVNRIPLGVIEAKPEGTTLSGVAEQTERYVTDIPDNLPTVSGPLPFAYESTGTETFFRNLKDPEPRSRRVFAFHQPKTLLEWFNEEETLRSRLKKMPPLSMGKLRACQVEAIKILRGLFQGTGRGHSYRWHQVEERPLQQ